MSDDREMRRQVGYAAILEGILSEPRLPRNPYLVFDNTGTIRFVSPNFESAFKYKPKDLVGKKYKDFISPDLYEIALRELAYRIDVVRDNPENFDLARFIERFNKDWEESREALSSEEKISHIERLIRAYSHKHSHEVEMYDSDVRIRLGDGRCMTVNDKFWLRKHQTEQGWEYAAAMVEFNKSEVQPGVLRKIYKWAKRVVASWSDLKPYDITNERVISIYSLDDPQEMTALVRTLLAENKVLDKPLVLDFREIGDVKEKSCEGILSLVKDLAQSERLIIGNAQESIRTAMTVYVERVAKATGKKPYQLNFHKLVYPVVRAPVIQGPESVRELKTFQELEKYVEEGIHELEAFANRVPEKRVQGSELGAEGKGDDVRGAGEVAKQQPKSSGPSPAV